MPRYSPTNTHSHAIKFVFLGPTNTKGSRLKVTDAWHKTTKYLPLSGADAMIELFNYIELELGYTVITHAYTDGGCGSDGVVMVEEFDNRIGKAKA